MRMLISNILQFIFATGASNKLCGVLLNPSARAMEPVRASFAASMQGLYPGGGAWQGQSAAGVYAAGYGLEPSSSGHALRAL